MIAPHHQNIFLCKNKISTPLPHKNYG